MIESKREIDYIGLFLILVMIFLAAIYLRSSQWTANLDLVFIALFCGFGIGLLLGKSRFDRPSILWLAIVFTLIFLFQIFSLVFDTSIPVIGRLFLIIHQAGISIQEFTSGKTISSPLIFLLTFTTVFWTLSLISAIAYIRHRRYLPMMLSVLVILMLVEFFLPERERNHWITAMVVFTGFLLYLHNVSYKISINALLGGKPISGKNKWTFTPAFLAIILVIVLVAWSVPLVVKATSPGTPEAQRFNRFSYQVRDNFFRITASLRGGTRSAAIGFGLNLPLGDSAADEETTVFTATVSRDMPSNQRTYWRAKVYESYQDGAWQMGEQKQMLLEPETEFVQPQESPRESVVTYRVKASLPLGDYFIPGELVSINNPANLIFSPQDYGGMDIIAVEPENTILPGNGYRMKTVIKNVEEPDMTKIDGDVPDWVKEPIFTGTCLHLTSCPQISFGYYEGENFKL